MARKYSEYLRLTVIRTVPSLICSILPLIQEQNHLKKMNLRLQRYSRILTLWMEIHRNNLINQLLWCKWVNKLFSRAVISPHLLHPQWISWRRIILWGSLHLPTIRTIKVELQLFPLLISVIIRAVIRTCRWQGWRETSWIHQHC